MIDDLDFCPFDRVFGTSRHIVEAGFAKNHHKTVTEWHGFVLKSPMDFLPWSVFGQQVPA